MKIFPTKENKTKVERLHTWWQKNKKPLEIIAVTLFLVGLLVLIVLIILGYIYNLDWTGLTSEYNTVTTAKTPQGTTITTGQSPAKSLWDWLQLLIIPAVLAIGGYVFNITVSRNERAAAASRDQIERKAAADRDKTERDIAVDNQQEEALQAYIDKMSELLLREKLRESQPEYEVQKIARVRTLTVLPRLDNDRKKSVLQFLYESGLINKKKLIINLGGANLSEANLFGANLSEANLSEANLSEANLFGANLSEANLFGANLSEADLSEAELRGADLRGAELRGTDLSGAIVNTEQLEKAWSLKGATMPDGSIHP